MFEDFEDRLIPLPSGIAIHARIGGEGPPILLLHGYPQTSACWHIVAPTLVAAGFSVVAPDLRGYGASDKPASSPDHLPYSKRVMAQDQVDLMRHLGHTRFCVAGHDRGGRVAHRMALDHPDAVLRLAVLDIAPTAMMYANTDRSFATAYYHWFFLIQPAPLPETLIGAYPDYYLRATMEAWSKSGMSIFSQDALKEYSRAFRDPACLSASCEDYRASASIDLEHDEADQETRIQAPLLTLWGTKGVVGKRYDVIAAWREKASDVSGQGFPVGHFLPEEAPQETADALIAFFAAASA